MYHRFGRWACGAALCGAILLLLRMKAAAAVFVLSAAGAPGAFAINYIRPPPRGIGDPTFAIIIIVIAVALVGYSVWLSHRGALR